jgi:hypothetical protein
MSPVFPTGTPFAHRSNRNGTTDTICRQCFATVATATWEAELERAERLHACDPSMLQHFRQLPRQEPRASLVRHRVNA